MAQASRHGHWRRIRRKTVELPLHRTHTIAMSAWSPFGSVWGLGTGISQGDRVQPDDGVVMTVVRFLQFLALAFADTDSSCWYTF
jgi:hypothetical protein